MEGNMAVRGCRSKSQNTLNSGLFRAKPEHIWIHSGSNIFPDRRAVWHPFASTTLSCCIFSTNLPLKKKLSLSLVAYVYSHVHWYFHFCFTTLTLNKKLSLVEYCDTLTLSATFTFTFVFSGWVGFTWQQEDFVRCEPERWWITGRSTSFYLVRLNILPSFNSSYCSCRNQIIKFTFYDLDACCALKYYPSIEECVRVSTNCDFTT